MPCSFVTFFLLPLFTCCAPSSGSQEKSIISILKYSLFVKYFLYNSKAVVYRNGALFLC